MASDWITTLLSSLGLLYDDILGLVNEAKAKFPAAADAIEYVAQYLREKVGDIVKDPTALAALIYAQLTAGGSDPDSGVDV